MTELTKAVILARGLGKRMRSPDDAAALDPAQAAVAETGVKALIPVGRPFLDHVLTALADAGFQDVCLVVGPEHHVVRDYYVATAPPARLRLHFAEQPEPRGTADAVLAAEAFAGRDPFAVLNSDNYYPAAALSALRGLPGPGLVGFEARSLVRLAHLPTERVRSFAVIRVGPDDKLEAIVEKPDPETLASLGDEVFVSMNCWRFGPAIFEACRRIPLSARGELELTAAVQLAMTELREVFSVVTRHDGVLDLGNRGDIATVAALLKGMRVHY